MEGTGSSPGPISEAQRHDLQQRLFDNFNALLFHREVHCQLCLWVIAAAGIALTHGPVRRLQGYRPSPVPQELIEQIAAVVEAKAFLHVVSVLLPMNQLHTQQQLHQTTNRRLPIHTGACGRAGHEQQADGADVRQGGCDAAAGRGGALHAATGGACGRLSQRQQRRHAAAVPQRVQWRPAQHTDRAQPAAQAQQATRRRVGVAGPG